MHEGMPRYVSTIGWTRHITPCGGKRSGNYVYYKSFLTHFRPKGRPTFKYNERLAYERIDPKRYEKLFLLFSQTIVQTQQNNSSNKNKKDEILPTISNNQKKFNPPPKKCTR